MGRGDARTIPHYDSGWFSRRWSSTRSSRINATYSMSACLLFIPYPDDNVYMTEQRSTLNYLRAGVTRSLKALEKKIHTCVSPGHPVRRATLELKAYPHEILFFSLCRVGVMRTISTLVALSAIVGCSAFLAPMPAPRQVRLTRPRYGLEVSTEGQCPRT